MPESRLRNWLVGLAAMTTLVVVGSPVDNAPKIIACLVTLGLLVLASQFDPEKSRW